MRVNWLVLPLCYLIGTFPSAELIARINGVDIRAIGSGNPGASNVMRMLGWKWGAAVMALDIAKGALATLLGLWAGGRPMAYAAAAAAVLGHMFPIWRHLRGGKGVATAGGGLSVLLPGAVLVLVPLWYIVSRVTGKASVASLSLVLLSPVAVWFATGEVWEVGASLMIALLVTTRHASNIRRLIRHDEPSVRVRQ